MFFSIIAACLVNYVHSHHKYLQSCKREYWLPVKSRVEESGPKDLKLSYYPNKALHSLHAECEAEPSVVRPFSCGTSSQFGISRHVYMSLLIWHYLLMLFLRHLNDVIERSYPSFVHVRNRSSVHLLLFWRGSQSEEKSGAYPELCGCLKLWITQSNSSRV